MQKIRRPFIQGLKLCFISLYLSSCTSLSKGGENVRLTSSPNVVQNCKFIGDVKAYPPYILPSDWEKKLKNATSKKGGNAVFALPPRKNPVVRGEAYICK